MTSIEMQTHSVLAFPLFAAFALGCRADESPPPVAIDPPASESSATGSLAADSSTVKSGETIYQEVCASCHGETGDGKGVVVFERPARSFLSGGFSFGNTPEALFRTVSHGIGGTAMPGFAATLTVAERRRVVERVIAFGPEKIPAAGSAAILVVEDRPVVVRGQLRGVAKGAPAIVRGLVVGTLDGLSWLYDASDVCLLAVRQGDFVKRTDWTGRGGTPLECLGKMIHRLDGGRPPAAFSLGSVAPRRALRAVLQSTRIQGSRAWVHYGLLDAARVLVLVDVRERGEAYSIAAAAGYRRVFHLSAPADPGANRTMIPPLYLHLCTGKVGELLRSRDGTLWVPTVKGGRLVVFGVRIDGVDHPEIETWPDSTAVRVPPADDLRVTCTTLLLPNDQAATWQELQQELR